MRIFPVFFCLVFSLIFIPGVLGTTICDGELCLTYVATYTTGVNTLHYIDYVNDTSFIVSSQNFIREFNESFLTVDYYNTPSDYFFGHGWDRDGGYYLGTYDGLTYDKIGKWNFTDEILYQTHVRAYGGGGDWYDGQFWIHSEYNKVYELSTGLSELGYCSGVIGTPGGLHHFNNSNRFIIVDEATDILYLYDENCIEKAELDISGTFPSVWGLYGITGNDDNTKIFLVDDRSPSNIYEFAVNLSSTESIVTPITPLDYDSFVDSNIVMELELEAGLNGTLECYINDVLKNNDSYENGTHEIDFSSGDLPDGENNWTCSFTDTEGFTWDFDLQTFTISSGIMNVLGESVAGFMGFETDEFSTGIEKGRLFLALLITFGVALGLGGEFKSPEIAGMSIVSLLAFFTFIGDIPGWVGVLLIILSGFIMVEWIKRIHHKS